jgi:antitoxin component YwqK of YwqJK toxin-antitoxin module
VNEPAEPLIREDFHRDGTLKARGQMLNGLLSGYWEWFRKDGTIMRCGNFERGEQVGEWKTFDAAGHLVKVTSFATTMSVQP